MWGMYRKLPFKQNLLVKAPFWVDRCTFVTFVELILMEGNKLQNCGFSEVSVR